MFTYDAFLFADAIEMDTDQNGVISTSELANGMHTVNVGMVAAAHGFDINKLEQAVENNPFDGIRMIADELVGFEGWDMFTDGSQVVELMSRANVLTDAVTMIDTRGDLLSTLVEEPVLAWMYVAAASDYYNTFMMLGNLIDYAADHWNN